MSLIAPKQLGAAPLIASKQQGVGGGLLAPKQLLVAPFTPADIAIAWLRADLGVSPPGGPVAAWLDQMPGNILDCVQATGSAQPTIAAAINGQATIHGTATSSQFLQSATALMLTEAHVFVILKQVVEAPNTLWRFGTAGGNDLIANGDGTIYDGFGSNTRWNSTTPHAGPALDSAGGVCLSVFTSTGHYLEKLNATTIINETFFTTTAWDAAGFLLFASSAGGIVPALFQDGDIAEIVLLDHEATVPELADLAAYFFARYGITI